MKGRKTRQGSRRGILAMLCVLGILTLAGGCKSLIVGKGYPQYEGELRGLPLRGPVTVLRDGNGIPHIYANDRHDLMVAQGFVHAQDRLWQMETLRRLACGRLAEVAGEARLNLDYFARLLGFPELRRRAARALGDEETALLQAYVDGVNANIRLRGKDLPLEFRSAGIVPEEWKVEDLFSFVVLNSWMFRENYRAELMVLAARQTVELQEWNDIFPSHPGAALAEDTYFESLRALKLGPLNRAALSFFEALPAQLPAAGGGSNAWVTAEGPGGKPLLANDTHVSISVPGTWYLCHLNAPGTNIVGASVPGVPGVIIGHTDTVAWGMTILPIDFVDLFVVRVNPQNPTRYFVGDRVLEMQREEMVIGLKGGEPRRFTAYRTIYGPVITEVASGVEGAVALRWYGTLQEGELTDLTMKTILGLMDCRSAGDIVENARHTRIVGLNLLAADIDGNIAWHSTGAVPVRRGFSGRLPADGSSGSMDWDGFLPYEQLPGAVNPPDGTIVNCNHRVVTDADPQPISNMWAAPYRYERVVSLLREMGDPSVDKFRKMQLDVYSLQAEDILPKALSYPYRDAGAQEAVRILRDWDRQVRAASQGAAV